MTNHFSQCSNWCSPEQLVIWPVSPSFRHSPPHSGPHMFLGGGWIEKTRHSVTLFSQSLLHVDSRPWYSGWYFFPLGNAISGTLLAFSSPAPSRKLKLSLRRILCIQLDLTVSKSNVFLQGSMYIIYMAGLLLYSFGTLRMEKYLNGLRQLVSRLVHSIAMTSRGWHCLTPLSTLQHLNKVQSITVYMLAMFFS